MSTLVLELYPSGINYSEYFNFNFQLSSIGSEELKIKLKNEKPKKGDTDFDFHSLLNYEYVIVVGAKTAQMISELTGYNVNTYQGTLIKDKYLLLPSPHILKYKPSAAPSFNRSIGLINQVVTGVAAEEHNTEVVTSQEYEKTLDILREVRDNAQGVVALDTENTSLYARKGESLGVSLAYNTDKGFYIHADSISQAGEDLLKEIVSNNRVVMHNAKYDMEIMGYHYRVFIDEDGFDDTMLMHSLLNENMEHGLKPLAIKLTSLGDYEAPLSVEKDKLKKKYKLNNDSFHYGYFPFEILSQYAALDAVATLKLYNQFKPKIDKSANLKNVYYNLLLPGSITAQLWEEVGVPFKEQTLRSVAEKLNKRIVRYHRFLKNNPSIKQYEEEFGELNVNSPNQLRALFFDFLGFKPTEKKTDKGLPSTDEEVLEELAETYESTIPKVVLRIKKINKVLNTYVNKVLENLDLDGRLRTRFNLHTTVSGRLSSSGTLNMQQLPRAGVGKLVKKCIEGDPGYSIVNVDIKTGEVYIAAALSKDPSLIDSFRQKVDHHSYIAAISFSDKIDCDVSEIKHKYPLFRQASKAISFAILYQAGASKLADTLSITKEEAQKIIDDYYERFSGLKDYITRAKTAIKKNGYVYSCYGRKRRVPDVFSKDRGVAGHAERSAINFLFQSVLSDTNLDAANRLRKKIYASNLQNECRVFAAVHDNLVAEVHNDYVDLYKDLVAEAFHSIEGEHIITDVPFGLDFSIGNNYAEAE